jgi:hypothetical protein
MNSCPVLRRQANAISLAQTVARYPMPTITLRLIAILLAVSFAGAMAQAKTAKKKNPPADKQTAVRVQPRIQNGVPAGPVYAYGEYMGDDPDPFIRLMLMRDAGSHFDGAQ